MSEKLETLIEQLGKLTVVEALELSKKLEEAWGVSATVEHQHLRQAEHQ